MTGEAHNDQHRAPFHLGVHGPADAPVVRVVGEIDVATAPELRDALHRLLDHGAHAIVIDLSGVNFLDSSGLGVLLGVHKRLLEQGDAPLRLTQAPAAVVRVLEITGLDRTFTLERTP
jgi:anti-sigma B factor antagonist